MTTPDKRRHPRSQFFLLKEDGLPLPVYAFREASDALAIPALLVDMSEGGVQVLTAQEDAPQSSVYELEIAYLVSADSPLKRMRVIASWQRADGVNVRTGFAFQENPATQALLRQCLDAAEHRLLRCVLHPIEVTSSISP